MLHGFTFSKVVVSTVCSLVIDAHHIITRTCVDSSFQFILTHLFFTSAVNEINLNHHLGTVSCFVVFWDKKLFNVCFFFMVLRNYNLFCTNFV